MSSLSFPAAGVAELFPTKGSLASYQAPKKTQLISNSTDCSHLPPRHKCHDAALPLILRS